MAEGLAAEEVVAEIVGVADEQPLDVSGQSVLGGVALGVVILPVGVEVGPL